ncbi:MAG TPA: hypothetical protein VGG34_03940 [Opitutaceae bacterium]|jgi:tetratricopeptide (TPR) repeat protein
MKPREALGVAGATAAAAALSVYFFSPRFVLWRLLGTAVTPPEVVRAADALRQLAHPLASISNDTNRVLEWRLFFPALGHLLFLNDEAYLALPSIGALVALGYCVTIARRRGLGWMHAAACAALLATSSWFFVSVGWLGYFDSWYVVALLLIVFARRHGVALAAVLVGPWIDERVAFTLPLCVFLRAVYMGDIRPDGSQRLGRRQVVGLFLGLLPWLLARGLFSLAGRDVVTARYIQHMHSVHGSISPSAYLMGLWEGIRLGWLYIAGLALCLLRVSPRRGALFIVLAVGTLAANLAVAEDLSRSVSVMAPAVLLGLILSPRPGFLGNPAVAAGAAALNLLLPAAHVIDSHRIPILYLQAELARNQDPLAEFNAGFYESRGVSYAMTGRDQLALEMLDVAIRIRPDFAEAISNRSLLEAKLGNIPSAMADADHALLLEDKVPDIWLNRGEIRMSLGDVHGAASDIAESIERSNADWPRLREARESLGRIRGTVYP